MDFTIEQIMALEAIARTGSFARAAKELHRVPSAISYSIRGLENALGVTLFDRSRRKAELTPSGRRVLTSIREIIDRGRALEQVAMEMRSGWEPDLHVVVDGALPMGPVNQCLRRFADPQIPTCLRIDVEFQEGVIEAFGNHDAHIALHLGFDSEEEAAPYTCIPLPELEFVLVAAATHPLVGVPLDEEQRAAYAELLVSDSSARFRKETKPSFIGSRNVAYLSDFHSKRAALLDGAGYGWVPFHLVRRDYEKGRLVLLDSEPNAWTYEPQLLTPVGTSLGRGATLFIDTLRGALGEAAR